MLDEPSCEVDRQTLTGSIVQLWLLLTLLNMRTVWIGAKCRKLVTEPLLEILIALKDATSFLDHTDGRLFKVIYRGVRCRPLYEDKDLFSQGLYMLRSYWE